MRFSVWTDVHMYAPNSLFKTPEEFLSRLNPKDPNEYMLGDVVDLANCKNKDVEEAGKARLRLKEVYGKRWIDGNHCRISRTNDLIFPKAGVVMAHGDFESWGAEKAIEYRSKPHGAGLFKRKLLVRAIEAYEKSVGRTLDQQFIENAVKLAKSHGCHTYVAGHLHPKEIIDIVADSIRIIIVPRGKTEIEI